MHTCSEWVGVSKGMADRNAQLVALVALVKHLGSGLSKISTLLWYLQLTMTSRSQDLVIFVLTTDDRRKNWSLSPLHMYTGSLPLLTCTYVPKTKKNLYKVPYGWKYWRELNFGGWAPKIAIENVLVDLHLAVRYVITICTIKKFWRVLIWQLLRQSAKLPNLIPANVSGHTAIYILYMYYIYIYIYYTHVP